MTWLTLENFYLFCWLLLSNARHKTIVENWENCCPHRYRLQQWRTNKQQISILNRITSRETQIRGFLFSFFIQRFSPTFSFFLVVCLFHTVNFGNFTPPRPKLHDGAEMSKSSGAPGWKLANNRKARGKFFQHSSRNKHSLSWIHARYSVSHVDLFLFRASHVCK